MVANKENLKERYMEYQLLMQQLQQLQQNVSDLEKHVVDLNSLADNLNSLNDSEADGETLMPLGSGIFVKGTLKDNKNIIMNVGANVCVEKTVPEAKGVVSKQLNEVGGVIKQIQDEINNTTIRLQELQSEFQNLREEELS